MSGPSDDTRETLIEVEDLVVRYGDTVAVDGVSFAVRAGEHVTLLGPSGCGKTTTLRAIAGLETPYSGNIRLDGGLVFSSSQNINVPTERRGLAMVFQSYAIWPHMSVADNVGYGLKVRGDSRQQREVGVGEALGMVEMSDFAKRSAANLSGGQQQRVALARALAVKPKLMLLDEPLSNLDARLRAGMRREMQQLQRQTNVTSIYVTHDQEEALVLSDRIIVMHRGHIAQMGSPTEIYNEPRNAFVADFVGAANLIGGAVRRDLCADGKTVLETPGKQLIYCRNPGYTLGDQATVALRPSFAQLTREVNPQSQNNWSGQIKQRVFLGDCYEYIVLCEDKTIVVRGRVDDALQEGEPVYISSDTHRCTVLEPEV